MAENDSKSIFQRPVWVFIFALTAALAWGWAYPLIKLGFGEFGINEEFYLTDGGLGTQALTASKMLFAGIRFCCSGLIVLAIAAAARRDFHVQGPTDTRKAANWAYITTFALINTTFHYAFFYIGLSNSPGARAAILNSMGVFLVVILACIFFESDKMTLRKTIGCCIGAAGIVALNVGGGEGEGSSFTFMGDGMIILNACCSAIAALMTRGLSKRIDVFVGTGCGLAIGGALLIIPGILAGGLLPQITTKGLGILLLLILISSLGFTLYNKLLSCNPVGKVAIYNSLIPVVGAITSCLCLHETFYWKYVVACALAAAGIYIINRGKS